MTEQPSDRELEIATAYVDGQTYKEIARSLDIAPSTVRTHLRTVYRKLGVTSRTELANALSQRHDGTPSARDDADLIAELSLQLDEAIRRERVLARVLRIISQKGHDLPAVIAAVLDHTLEICEAEFGILFEYCGDLRFRARHSRNIPERFSSWLTEQDIFSVEPETGLGRVATELATVNIVDVRGEDIYRHGAPLRIATAELGGARSFVAIPMMSDSRLLGAFTIYRTRVHPFRDRSLELAQLFADQAAIAIENAGLKEARDHAETALEPAAVPVPPLLAVLPFRAADETDDDARRLGRRVAAELSMELSSNPLFRVIDQTSSFSPRLMGQSALQSAERLGARLVASGSVRRLGSGRYRLALELHEAGRPAAIHQDVLTYSELQRSDLLEDLITRLCAAIGTRAERSFLSAAKERGDRSPLALDQFLMGLEHHHVHNEEGYLEARRHFENAVSLDAGFARAEAALAITYVREWFWKSDNRELLDVAEDYARRALTMDSEDAWSLTVSGVVALYKRRHGEAAAHFEAALERAPYDAYVVSRAGLGRFYSGNFEDAAQLFQRAIILDPLHADRQRGMLGHAYLHLGRYDEALAALRAVRDPLLWELAWMAACQALSGDESYRDTSDRYRNMLGPKVQSYRAPTRPFKNEADMLRLDAAMKLAGLI
ncbi:LuxR C-terminal-related transcriptional regulator [Marivita geojedonensis]|uniref:LuxR C-terminal-related transcriptional regulator n=1 Tax=Marivita geojedonensis TaxID=1123756 RepID=UPI000A1DE610|nr:LuxR C-terminal-related transcriptional regulator [Marivita geojedonensis]PRY79133.1 tetratricopeptide repeat protein [Marivita geojedonensis]